MIESLNFDRPLQWHLLWNSVGFGCAIVVNSFVEWIAHRFILHSDKIVKFAHKLHHIGHHGISRGDETYHAETEEAKNHVKFVGRDYLFFLIATTPLWVIADLVTGKSVVWGGIAATLFGLKVFNWIHWHYHVPSEAWIQKTRLFSWAKAHHRAHHHDTSKNLNVSTAPLGDLVMGTLVKGKYDELAPAPVPLTPEPPPIIVEPHVQAIPQTPPVPEAGVLIEPAKTEDVVLVSAATPKEMVAVNEPAAAEVVPAPEVVAPLVEVVELTVAAALPQAKSETKFRRLTREEWGFRKLNLKLQKKRSKAKVGAPK